MWYLRRLALPFGIILVVVACSRTNDAQRPTDQSPKLKTEQQPGQKKPAPPAYLGTWRLDVEAYEQSSRYKALDEKRKQAVSQLLRKAKSELMIQSGSLSKLGQFGTKTVSEKHPYQIIEKMGEVWSVEVNEAGRKVRQEWRMSGDKLVIRVQGKDRVFSRLSGPGDSSVPTGNAPLP